MATMEDVAKTAGVSPSTVSHVINETRFVREETKNRVIKAMRALNYYPNYAARSLRCQKSRIIGLLMPDIANTFYMTVVKGVEGVMRRSGYSLLVCNSDDDLAVEREHLSVFNSQLIDGLIMRATPDDHGFLEELISGYPTVFVDCKPNGYEKGDRVLVDNEQSSYEAVSLLLKKGHTKVGIITGIDGLTSSEERLAGYKQALIDHGVQTGDNLIRKSNSRIDSGYDLMKELLAEGVTAVFTGNNVVTIGAMRLLKEKGLRIPDEVAIFGFDDREWCEITDPPLTVVRQPAYEIGEKAAELLLQRLAGNKSEYREYRLPTELVTRQSC